MFKIYIDRKKKSKKLFCNEGILVFFDGVYLWDQAIIEGKL